MKSLFDREILLLKRLFELEILAEKWRRSKPEVQILFHKLKILNISIVLFSRRFDTSYTGPTMQGHAKFFQTDDKYSAMTFPCSPVLNLLPHSGCAIGTYPPESRWQEGFEERENF